jgi:hypothetical protein
MPARTMKRKSHLDDEEENQSTKKQKSIIDVSETTQFFFTYGHDDLLRLIFECVGCRKSLLLVNKYWYQLMIENDEYKLELLKFNLRTRLFVNVLPSAHYLKKNLHRIPPEYKVISNLHPLMDYSEYTDHYLLLRTRIYRNNFEYPSAQNVLVNILWKCAEFCHLKIVDNNAFFPLQETCKQTANIVKTENPDSIVDYELLFKKSLLLNTATVIQTDLLRSLMTDRCTARCYIQVNSVFLQYAEQYRDDFDFVKEAVTYHSMALEHASDKYKNNKCLVRIAVMGNGMALQFASDELKADESIVRLAVINTFKAMQFVSRKSKNYRELAITMFWLNPAIIEYLSPQMKKEIGSDREMALYTAQKDPMKIRFFHKFQSDKQVMLTAVKNNGFTMQYTSDELQDDPDIVQLAISTIQSTSPFDPSDVEEDHSIKCYWA